MKKGQAILVAPLQPHTLAAFRPWGILRELVARDLPRRKDRAQPVRTLRFMNKISVAAPHGVHAALGSFVLTLTAYLVQSEWLVDFVYSFKGKILFSMLSLAFWAVLSLIVAAIMERAPKTEFA